MLTSDELAQVRATQGLTMLNQGTIYRLSRTSDGMGGTSEVWTSVLTIPCRVSAGSASDSSVLAGQLRERAPWRVTVPALTDIRVTDRIQVDGRTLEVVGIDAPSTYETARVCICAEA